MPGLLIDDVGAVWPEQPETLTRRFHPARGCDFRLQAVALGVIFIRFCDSGARIALRPQFASSRAIACLFDIIMRSNPVRIAIAHDPQLASWEMVCGLANAIVRLEQIVAEARQPSPRPLLYSTRQPLSRTGTLEGGQLTPILRAWQDNQGLWSPDLYGRLLEWKLLPKVMIAERPRRSQRLVVRHWGSYLKKFGKDWTRIAPGRDLEEQPDAAIGRWQAALHSQLLAGGEPWLEAVDIVLRRPDGDLARLRFHRLGLPWQTAKGGAMVSGITVGRRMTILERVSPTN